MLVAEEQRVINMLKIDGTQYFLKLVKACKKMSPHIRFVRARYGFYRVYWKDAYIHECSKDMPLQGYDFEDEDVFAKESLSHYEEFEDINDRVMMIKNFKEGYWDAFKAIETRVYMIKHDKEFNETAHAAYKTRVIK